MVFSSFIKGKKDFITPQPTVNSNNNFSGFTQDQIDPDQDYVIDGMKISGKVIKGSAEGDPTLKSDMAPYVTSIYDGSSLDEKLMREDAQDAGTKKFLDDLGASGTSLEDLEKLGGALPKATSQATLKTNPLEYAKQIAEGAFAGQTGSEPDWGVASLLYFSKLAENASKPGATFLGAAGSAGTAPAAYLMQKEKEKADLETKKASLVASLVPSIIKAGTTKNFKTLTDLEAQKLGYDTKDGTITFQQDTSTNEVKQVTKTPLVDMTQKGKGIWATDGAKANIKAFSGYREDSKKARQALGTYDQLLDILADPDFETNYKEEKLLGVRKIVSSLGLGDKDDLAKITKADLFRTKTYELVLASVSQMKGALSDKELNFLQDQTASLGKNKETNQIVLLTMKKRLEAASKFDDFALKWQEENLKDDEGKARTIHTDLEYERMMRDWRKEPINQENPYQYVERLSNEYKAQLVKQMGGELNNEGNIVSGSLEQNINGKQVKIPAGSNLEQLKAEEIANKIEGKFARSQFKKIFGGYFSLSGQGDRT